MSASIEQAVVFADRSGKELAPLFQSLCPALLPVAGKTPLQYTLDDLAGAGIQRILIVVSAASTEVQQRIGAGRAWGMTIDYVLSRGEEMPDQLIRRCMGQLDEQFLALRGDILRSAVCREFLAGTADSGRAHALIGDSSAGMCLSDREQPDLASLAWPPPAADTLSPRVMLDGHACNLLTSLADYHRGCLDLAQGRFPGLILNSMEVDHGVRRGRLSHLHDASVVRPPLLLGDHSSLHQSCKVYGPVVVDAHCFIDRETQLINTVVLPDTYIGAGLDLADAIVGEGRLIKPAENIALIIDDPLWLATMSPTRLHSVSPRRDRLLALVLLLLSLPLWLVALVTARPGPNGGRLQRQPMLGNRRNSHGQRQEYVAYRWRTGVPVLRALPGLLAVLGGHLRLFGAQPAPARDPVKAQDQPPVGLIAAANLFLHDDPPREEIELFDLVFAAERTWRKELACAKAALKRLISSSSWRPEAGTPQSAKE